MDELRPTPEEMLARAREEEPRARGGRLKIFFGASPGVGKTYAMLEEAQARRRDGTDVVIGWVETHGRAETDALTRNIERLQPRVSEYRGLRLRDFDIDAALARRPGLLIVDELAHTNAPGSRHARRWLDVMELLDAGIDVHTTLNVQHVESLNDVVAIITGVAVQETVPDSVLERADEIELVDLPPESLLQRLQEGKVYIPDQAERAIENFFRKSNLVALRELALRQTAERIHARTVAMEGGARPRSTQRILVPVGPVPGSANLVRFVFRMAARNRAPWIALSVETPAFDRQSAANKERVAADLALAERLGAETLVVRGERAAEEILAVARERNVTRVVVARPGRHPAGHRRFGKSLAEELVARSGDIDVFAVARPDEEPPPAEWRVHRRHSRPLEYAQGVIPVLAATLLGLITRNYFTLADQAMIYLLAILIAATRHSYGPSLLAAVASVAVFDLFFVPPYYTFEFADLRYFFTFLVMLAVGVIVSRLTVRIREQGEAARQRERRTATLFAMSREFAIETGVLDIARTAVRHVKDLLDTEAGILLADDGGRLVPRAGDEAAVAGSERDLAVARWVFEHGKPAGRGTSTLPATDSLYLPLIATFGTLGVFGVRLATLPAPLTPSQRQLLETFVAQAALALERAHLAEEAGRSRVTIETERTRSALLSTVSHDLRTPLASISGSAQVLLDSRADLEPAARRDLLETIREEAARLNRLVENLLDLTRLESGALEAKKEWYPVEESIVSAVARLKSRLEGRPVRTQVPDDVLLFPVDPILFEQLLINLIENAVKYSPPESPIEIAARSEGDDVVLEVADRGPGIPPGEEERIFEKFYRAPEVRGEGAGLGLAVCRAIIRAHGGRLIAENRPGGGAVFRVILPLGGRRPAPALPAEAAEQEMRT